MRALGDLDSLLKSTSLLPALVRTFCFAWNLQGKQGEIRAMVERVWELPQRSSDVAVIGGLDEGFDGSQKRRCSSRKEVSTLGDLGGWEAGSTLGRVANLGHLRDVAVSERMCVGVPRGIREAHRWPGTIPKSIGGARMSSAP